MNNRGFILYIIYVISGSRIVVTSQGDLHIKSVRPEDGRITYSCLTRHSLTGETRKSEPVSLTVTGYLFNIQTNFISCIITYSCVHKLFFYF